MKSKLSKNLTLFILAFGLLYTSGCWVTKTGSYIKDKSKSAYSATKSALGFEEDSNNTK
ncbi:MAG: hypothetical protein VX467_01600 [Verrucomicrobiota bacterium]|nr:hypothetical protein [Verrucomicrobiota bacterium]